MFYGNTHASWQFWCDGCFAGDTCGWESLQEERPLHMYGLHTFRLEDLARGCQELPGVSGTPWGVRNSLAPTVHHKRFEKAC